MSENLHPETDIHIALLYSELILHSLLCFGDQKWRDEIGYV